MNQDIKISVIGLGYVGILIATEFAKSNRVIGFDVDPTRIQELKNGQDRNNEVTAQDLKEGKFHFTTQPEDLQQANFHIITVPTPVDKAKHPDFSILMKASETVGKQLKIGDIVVYESTVYPGATEEICIPILEKFSKMKCGDGFSVGYSPERINPADKVHTFANIKKIISANDSDTLNIMAKVYGSVVKAGVHPVSRIKVAEATKVIENTQRDLNISLVNEFCLILNSLGIEATEVLNAAKTKWNFMPFQPGLVGGHCIGVNSLYLTHKSEEEGYYSNLIHAGRRINDVIPKFIARETIKKLILKNRVIKNANIAVLGFTYKENCNDYRDTKVIDLINELKSFGMNVLVHDPIADPVSVKKSYNIDLQPWENLKNLEAMILAVTHQEYLNMNIKELEKQINPEGFFVDVKGIMDPKLFQGSNLKLWRI